MATHRAPPTLTQPLCIQAGGQQQPSPGSQSGAALATTLLVLSFLPAAAAHGLISLADLTALTILKDSAAAASTAHQVRIILLGGAFGGLAGPPSGGAAWVAASAAAAAAQAVHGEAGGHQAADGVTAVGASISWHCCADFGEAVMLQALQGQLHAERVAEAVALELLPATCCGLLPGLRLAGGREARAVEELLGASGQRVLTATVLVAHPPLRTLLLDDGGALYAGLWSQGAMAELASSLPGAGAGVGAGAAQGRLWALPQRLALQSLAAGALHIMTPNSCLMVQPATLAPLSGTGDAAAAPTAAASAAAVAPVAVGPCSVAWQLLPPGDALPLGVFSSVCSSGHPAADVPLTLALLGVLRCVRPGWLEGTWPLMSLLLDEKALSEALRREGSDAAQVREGLGGVGRNEQCGGRVWRYS